MVVRTGYHLARSLVAGYALLVIYASLHPFSGWHDGGTDVLAFIVSPWPRYFTWFDVVVNVVAYMPLGFLLVPSLRTWVKPGWAVVIALVLASSLSLSLEILQNFLPTRVPSNVDWGSNSSGALLGALAGARWGGAFADHGWVARWRARRIVRGRRGDIGLLLLGGWLLTQLAPAGISLGTGDLRAMFGLPTPIDYSAGGFLMLEMSIAACALLAAGLLARQTMRDFTPWLLALLFVLVAVARSLSAALFFGADDSLRWLTQGTLDGVAIGALCLVLALGLPGWLQRVIGGIALLAATALVNFSPDNPYAAQIHVPWNAGQFLNFNGLTRVVSVMWPFAALAYLMTPAAERGRH